MINSIYDFVAYIGYEKENVIIFVCVAANVQ